MINSKWVKLRVSDTYECRLPNTHTDSDSECEYDQNPTTDDDREHVEKTVVEE
jgi:hypothetical protein